MNEDRTYEAWLDETNRVVSFHAIPAARHFRAAGEEFWSADPDPRPLRLPDPVKRS